MPSENNPTEQEIKLVTKVTQFIRDRFAQDRHFVGAGAIAENGKEFLSINLSGSPRGIDICGEPGVISQVISNQTEIKTVVAVRYEGPLSDKCYVVSPCGTCRELIARYFPNASVIVLDGDELRKISALDLLPYRYAKEKKI